MVSEPILLKAGEDLAIFFFNEINSRGRRCTRCRLAIMAERSLTAFNREYQFPHLLVFADRNLCLETFESPVLCRDRFLMEIGIEGSEPFSVSRRALVFDPVFTTPTA